MGKGRVGRRNPLVGEPWKFEKHFGAKRMELLQERDGK